MSYNKCHTVTKAVQEQTVKAVDEGRFCQKQDYTSTISTKGMTSIRRKITTKKGGTFGVVKKNNVKEEEGEEDISLTTYEEYPRENGVGLLNVGDVDPVFGGDSISEFGIGCVQVDDALTPVTTKGMIFVDARE